MISQFSEKPHPRRFSDKKRIAEYELSLNIKQGAEMAIVPLPEQPKINENKSQNMGCAQHGTGCTVVFQSNAGENVDNRELCFQKQSFLDRWMWFVGRTLFERMHMESCRMLIRDTEKGKAVFADADIRKGGFICEFTGPTYTMDEYKKLHDPSNNHFLQIDDDRFMGPSHNADDLINHSCDPNCGLVYRDGIVKLIAIREIVKGEELSFDYSTTMDEDCWEMECLCGGHNCRKVVRDFKYLPPDVQKKYIALGVVMPFIVKKITVS
ncbi:MAG: hypothetical protein A2176_08815 [Spirochaetes bacterium RBG_13_51_14]|nr:MAG: hypothetical protein A2176_08815 [Spirochaetes bacterium RBG_13_51_14]